MRTDSNTALSSLLTASPQKSAQGKSSPDSGSVFAADLNKSREALTDKPIVKQDGSESSSLMTDAEFNVAKVDSAEVDSAGVDSASLLQTSDVSDSGLKESKEQTSSPTAVSSSPAAVSPTAVSSSPAASSPTEAIEADITASRNINAMAAEPSGKKLQPGGDSLPVIPPMELKQAAVTPVSPQNVENVEGNVKSAEGSVISPNTSLVVDETQLLAAEIEFKDVVVTPVSRQSDGVVDHGLVNNLTDVKNLTSTHSNEVVSLDSQAIASSENLSELNWVLTQMGMSKARMDSSVATTDSVERSPFSSVLNASSHTPAASLSLLNEELQKVALSDSSIVDLDDVTLENQPLELRKKEQEALFTRSMSATASLDIASSDASALESTKESRLSDINVLLQNNSRATAGVLTGATVQQASAMNNLTMNVPPGHPSWAGEMSQKIAWVARDGGHTAHIRLDPPELGSLTVKVSVDSDSNTQISFIAATPQARDMLESQMGRLREMLAQQGMDLSRADVDVSQQDASGAEQQDSSENRQLASSDDGADEDEFFLNKTSYVSSSGVDYYA